MPEFSRTLGPVPRRPRPRRRAKGQGGWKEAVLALHQERKKSLSEMRDGRLILHACSRLFECGRYAMVGRAA